MKMTSHFQGQKQLSQEVIGRYAGPTPHSVGTWVCLQGRVPNFEQKNYSAKDGTKQNRPLFCRNSTCFENKKIFGIPLLIIPKLKIFVEIRQESFRSWKFSLKLVAYHSEDEIFSPKFFTNHFKTENFRRNSLQIIPKLKMFVGICFATIFAEFVPFRTWELEKKVLTVFFYSVS